ncbi:MULTISPECIES: TetR/AcrR family transcriptional regulator [Pimelobacter]|uniref:TetR/AcrR family transcriptional regulator n=1 Tax=Pimelobacter TaxID=2044 RepID=UPI001C04D489|nr:MULTISPECIES: TetR/AcrR family transcriptional regulator [Pimelobacter]UUW88901.1 TetR/AcrR family transcriptional regulator [Pimelobacter simplex]UUW98406.1 TetR/AcrR family transcriptional regulator [Pimelobacter simplex]
MSAPAEASSRARILAATAQVVGQQGITAFAIKDVAEAAEVTPQLLYYYFPNREALVAAALEYANEQAPSINLLQGDAGGRGFDAVHQALRAEFDDDPSVRNLNILWNEVASLSTQFPELQSTLERVTSGWDQQITVGVLRGIVDRSLRGDLEPGLVAQALTCAVEGLSQRWLAGVTSGEQARSALDRMLVALAGQGPEGG